MMKKIVASVFAGSVLVFLTACGPSFDRGEVTKKDFTRAGCTVVMVAQQSGNSTIMVPQTNCWGDSWDIQIRNCETDKCYLDTKSVSPEGFDRCNVGDQFPDCTQPGYSKENK